MPPNHPLIKPAERPKVIIVGAGIGGITLAILLEKAGVPYDVYERSTEVRPIGSALFLGPTVAPLLKQIGIYDEIVSHSKPCHNINVYDEQLEPTFVIDFSEVVEMGGFEGYIISRYVLYDILRKQVPTERIHTGKKVLSIMQNENGVMIRCADGSTADGDILVGADGAYSGVRQSLYKQLEKAKKLPPSDADPLPYSSVTLVAQSSPIDLAKFPELSDTMCHFNKLVAKDSPYSWSTITTTNNAVCWGATKYLDKESSKENDSFRASEWGVEAAEAMCSEVRDFPILGGNGTLTLGDIIDNTPRERISKVTLEEKVFETWYHGRTVLMGDACHKVNPAGGQGATLAFHDAIALANWINVLPSTTLEDAEKIFVEYREERYPPAKAVFAHGKTMASVYANSVKATITRFVMGNMPRWLWRISNAKNTANRPQVSFLPLIQDNGTVKPQHQPSLYKTLEMISAAKEL